MTTGRTPRPENGDRWAGSVPSLPVAWLCGILYGVGLFLQLLLIASLAVAALATFGAFNAEAWILLAAGLGLLMTAVGPGLMARHLTGSWRRGFLLAPPAVAASVVGGVLAYLMTTMLGRMASTELFLVLMGALPAAGAVSAVLLRAGAGPGDLAYGLLLGLGQALGHGLLIAPEALPGDNVFHLLWQAPPLVWTSAVLFSVPGDGLHRRAALAVFVGLVALSVVLPSLSPPLLRALGLWF